MLSTETSQSGYNSPTYKFASYQWVKYIHGLMAGRRWIVVLALLVSCAPALGQKDTAPVASGITLCVGPMAGGFDGFIVGEMEKQQVPVTIVSADPDPAKGCDPSKSAYTMTGNVEAEGKSFSARNVFGLRFHLRDEVQAAVKLVRNSDSVVVWAGDSDRGEVKKVAEHIVNQMLKQRPKWLPSPVNR